MPKNGFLLNLKLIIIFKKDKKVCNVKKKWELIIFSYKK